MCVLVVLKCEIDEHGASSSTSCYECMFIVIHATRNHCEHERNEHERTREQVKHQRFMKENRTI
jgi:hypothetical protein